MLLEILLGLILLILVIYVYFHKVKYRVWVNNGIKQLPASFPFGNLGFLMTGQTNIGQGCYEQYEQARAAGHKNVYGLYFLSFPLVGIGDPDLIRQMLVKDFDHFVDRSVEQTNKHHLATSTRADKIWVNSLLNLSGDKWKETRATFSPIFSSGNIKAMSVLMDETTKKLVSELKNYSKTGESFEARSLMNKVSLDVITSCAFGLNAGAFEHQHSPMVEEAKKLFTRHFTDGLKTLATLLPFGLSILRFFEIPLSKGEPIEFFYNVVKQTMQERVRSKQRRNDLIDLMIDALKGDLVVEEEEEEDNDQYEQDSKLVGVDKLKSTEVGDDELIIVATALVLLVAGYDTTGTLLSFLCYEMVKNPHVQQKLQEEIDEVLDTIDNKDELHDYNAVQEMPYLDMVVQEALRLHPVASLLARACNKPWKMPGTSYTMPVNMTCFISIIGIHMDPDNYPDPQRFDPERFTKEAKAKRHPYTYLPFGHGPRNCIGKRFALTEAKLALVAILKNFNLLPCSQTPEVIRLDPASQIGAPLDPIMIKAESRY